MIIRELTDKELEALAQIDKQVNLSPWSLINYEQSFTNQNHHIIGIFSAQNMLIGGCTYSIIMDEREILQVCIARDHQQNGYAKRMLEHIIKELEENKIAEIFLEVLIDNQPAINLYQQLGFNVISTRKNYYLIQGQRFDALIMGKTLCLK